MYELDLDNWIILILSIVGAITILRLLLRSIFSPYVYPRQNVIGSGRLSYGYIDSQRHHFSWFIFTLKVLTLILVIVGCIALYFLKVSPKYEQIELPTQEVKEKVPETKIRRVPQTDIKDNVDYSTYFLERAPSELEFLRMQLSSKDSLIIVLQQGLLQCRSEKE